MNKKRYIENIDVGNEYEMCWIVSPWKIILTLLATGDFNRIHWDPFTSHGNGIIAPGTLTFGFVSATIADFVANGSQVTQTDATFKKNVYAGDRIKIHIKVIKINTRNNFGRIQLDITVKNCINNDLIMIGSCDVFVPRKYVEKKKVVIKVEKVYA